jgi:formylglycine-generating enzyme required for sulfatase activity
MVNIDWVPVGHPGNAPDTVVMTTDGTSGYGAVPYSYNIGKYDVTNSQYAEFLNTKDASGANLLRLWNSDMGEPASGGISFNGLNPAGSRYVLVAGRQKHPVNYVTWYDAVRFANWLNNGQGDSDTETGAYTLLHEGSPTPTPVPSNALSITRNPGATVFLPNENEWYKAAYYNPATNSFFLYPTSSNTAPTAEAPPGGSNSANYYYPFRAGNLTDVGAYTGTTSPVGAFDMGGNVIQWNETMFGSASRGVRGGGFSSFGSGDLLSSTRTIGPPQEGFDSAGFRVATVPEPSTAALAVVACGTTLSLRRRILTPSRR